MNLPEDTHLAYIVWHEAWYSEASRTPGEYPHLMVSAASDGGGVAWEFQIDGYDLSGPVTRVKMFMDSYAAFAQMPEFFAALADQQHAIGAVDETPRVSPYPDRPSVSRAARELAEDVASLVRTGAIGTARELLDEASRTQDAMKAERP